MKLKKSTIKFLQKNKGNLSKNKKIKKPRKNHKSELKDLKDKDPKFYNYLKENDQELLNFSDDSGVEDEDMHGIEDDLADSDSEIADVQEEEDELENLGNDGDIEGNVDQVEGIRDLAQKIQSSSNYKSLVQLAKAFKSVANMGEDEECLDWDENMINEIVSSTLDVVPDGLDAILSKENREKSKKWKKLAPVIKSFLTNLLKIMKNTTDSKVLVEIIKKSSGFITYYSSFPKLLKEFYKELLEFWSMGDERVRIAAFLVLRRCCLSCPSIFLEKVFKGALKAINQVSNFNSFSLTKLKFMNSCLVELSGLSLYNTYSFGFLGIRELALSLKNATSTSDYTIIQSWPFVNSIRLWADVIATYGNSPNGGENLKHLVYPLVQISVGVLRLCPNSKNYPMHLIILQTLLNLSEKTGVFIPISPYLMEILSSSEITAKAKPSTLKPLDFSGILLVPSGYMSTSVYQKGLFECVLDLFFDYFAIPSISFPELCIPISTFLKRWSKKSKNPYMNKNVRVLLEKIEEQSMWTEKERSRLNISPMDFKSMVSFSSFKLRLNGARTFRDLPCRSTIRREDCIRQETIKFIRNETSKIKDQQSRTFFVKFELAKMNQGAEAVSIPSPSLNKDRFERRHSSLTTEKKVMEGQFSKSQPKDLPLNLRLEADDDSETIPIESQIALPLTPFKNQVGGHTSFLRFSEKALCKPLDIRERDFYETLDKSLFLIDLKPFVASYLGCVNVKFKEPISDWLSWVPVVHLDDNKHFLVDDPNLDLEADLNSSRTSLNRKMQRQIFKEAWSPKSIRARYENMNQAQSALNKGRSSFAKEDKEVDEASLLSVGSQASLTHFKGSKKNKMSTDTMGPIFQMSDDDESILEKNDEILDQEQFNPWSLHLYSNQVSKLASIIKTGTKVPHEFLLLQDLTHGLDFPCILDLKMGTRQHGVMASLEKKQSQERKCERSTSKKIGVRICGMQTFKNDTGCFAYLDKYVGRGIHAANFKTSLLSFLDNGTHYLVGYIPQIIKKLVDLSAVIQELPKCRFYASSLLIIYDGSTFETNMEVQVKMIDFSNCVVNADHLYDQFADIDHDEFAIRVNYPPTTKGPDQGYLLGLKTLIKNFEELYRELGGLENGSHVLKENVSKSARLVMEVGSLTPMNDLGPTYADGTSPLITDTKPVLDIDTEVSDDLGSLKL